MATITLPDGRTLAYAEYGDLRGKPVFFFHGTPGSRFFRPPDEITARLGVRLICVDRPGYGESSFQPGRRILDWPKDVARMANALSIQKFCVAGHSGGGPHTLACAYALPERVSAAATLSGVGPVNTPGATLGMTMLNKLGFKYGQYIPWMLWRPLIWWIFRERCADPAKAMDREIGLRPPADDELIARPEIRQACLQSEVEAFRPGLKGMSWEVRLITRPWGFQLDEIRMPVYLWHGTADNATFVAMAQYMAGRIPDSKLTICEGEGHLLLFPHWENVLSQLFSE
jgi:pimeloyl-ACP methyl ester carboxylesterase